jgi:hypothetical protein
MLIISAMTVDLAHKLGISVPSLLFRGGGKKDFFESSARILIAHIYRDFVEKWDNFAFSQ